MSPFEFDRRTTPIPPQLEFLEPQKLNLCRLDLAGAAPSGRLQELMAAGGCRCSPQQPQATRRRRADSPGGKGGDGKQDGDKKKNGGNSVPNGASKPNQGAGPSGVEVETYRMDCSVAYTQELGSAGPRPEPFNSTPMGGQSAFVWLPARTPHVGASYVW